MHNNQNEHWTHKADSVPALPAIYDPVWNDHMQWIVPDPLGEIKGDIMLREVNPGLIGIPLEAGGHDATCWATHDLSVAPLV